MTVRVRHPTGVSVLFQRLIEFRPAAVVCVFVLAMATGQGASAAQLSGLYEASAPLADEGSRARDAAFVEAMEQVLVRVTGRRDIARDPAVGELLAQPGAYVQQFRETDEGDLWVSFDKNAVDEVLSGSGLPIWGGERPAVLMLLAMDLGGGRRSVLAAEDEVPDPETLALRESVNEQAELRGLPLVLPLMDAQDRSVVSFTDLWGGFDQVLLAAAQRYGVDAVLLGRFRYDEPDRIRWTLFEGTESWRWTGRFSEGIDGAGDQLAARYAVATGSALEGEVGLAVSGVSEYSEFARVLRYLQGLTAVERVAVRTLDDDQVVFGLSLRGNLENVDQAIRLGGILSPDENGAGAVPTTDSTDARRVAIAYRLK